MSPAPTGETERVRAIWDRLAATYDRASGLEARLLGDGRAWAAAQATGDVLEIAVGTGRNLSAYAPDIRLTAVDISPRMLAFAADRAEAIGRQVDLGIADAQALPFADASFNSVVCTMALCSIPDDRQACGEVFRVLRPGGTFVLIEHVRSPHRVVRAVQGLMDRWSIPRSGDHHLRDPLDHLEPLGFEVEFTARSRLGIYERVLARRPNAAH